MHGRISLSPCQLYSPARLFRVRAPGKVIRVQEDECAAVVLATDGGEVKVIFDKPTELKTTYVEIVVSVIAKDEIKAELVLEMSDNFDLSLMNFAIEQTHDPKFGLNLKPNQT